MFAVEVVEAVVVVVLAISAVPDTVVSRSDQAVLCKKEENQDAKGVTGELGKMNTVEESI